MKTRVLDCELWNMHLHIKATNYPPLRFNLDSSDVEYTCNITFHLKAQHFVHTQLVYIRAVAYTSQNVFPYLSKKFYKSAGPILHRVYFLHIQK